MKTKNSDAIPAPEFSFIIETSTLARETLKLFYYDFGVYLAFLLAQMK